MCSCFCFLMNCRGDATQHKYENDSVPKNQRCAAGLFYQSRSSTLIHSLSEWVFSSNKVAWRGGATAGLRSQTSWRGMVEGMNAAPFIHTPTIPAHQRRAPGIDKQRKGSQGKLLHPIVSGQPAQPRELAEVYGK